MLKKNSILVILFLMLNVCYTVFADTTDAMSYLRMGLGARALSMGGAFTGVSDDASAIFWNPAGISKLEKTEIISMYSLLSLERSLNTICGVYRMSYGSFGLSIINSGVTGIKGYDENQTFTGDFNYQSNTVFISYANSIQENLSMGGNLKVITDILKDNNRTGFGFDFGILSNVSDRFSIGIKMQDIGSKIGEDNLPISINLGFAYRFIDNKLTVATDLNKISDKQNIKLRIGSEYKLADIFSFGVGINDSNISFGINLFVNVVSFSYAYLTDNFKLNDSHYISLGAKF